MAPSPKAGSFDLSELRVFFLSCSRSAKSALFCEDHVACVPFRLSLLVLFGVLNSSTVFMAVQPVTVMPMY